MTNSEAIRIINQYDCNFYWTDGEKIPTEDLLEAFDLAVKALKEQEPRVLTLDEVRACSPRSDWLWVEENAYGSILESAIICAQIYCFENGWLAFDAPKESHDLTIDFGYDSYGITWRCWSARPTDEQRARVKWNDTEPNDSKSS